MDEDRKRLRKLYLDTFSTTSGQAVLEDLKNRFFWYDTTYSPIPGETNINEGSRRAVLHIINVQVLQEEQKESEKDVDNG